MLTRRAMIVTILSVAPARAMAGFRSGLAEIIDNHTRARGGAMAIDAIRSERAGLIIEEGGSKLDAVYQCGKEPFFRIDIYSEGKHIFCEGLDREGAWMWDQKAPNASSDNADAKRTGLQGIEFNMYGLHRFRERGHRLALLGRESVEGTSYHVIRVQMKDSYETYLFINPDSWMIDRRRDFRAFHPGVDDTKKFIDKKYSDYRAVNGVMMAFVEEQFDLKTGKLVNSSRIRTAEYNHSYKADETGRHYRPA